MPTINFNDANFRAQFPAFANQNDYTPQFLQIWWNNATSYISNQNQCGWYSMTLAQQTLALNYMTAHLVELNKLAGCGEDGGIVTSATVDKVSVSLQPPPDVNQWQWWLNQTPYGKQLLALLQLAVVGGRMINPRPVLSAFRR